jgi:hypothetical protein
VSNVRRLTVLWAALSVSGCALHPLPEDVTGVPTHTIVRQIRCEARAAVKDNLTDWLDLYNNPDLKRMGLEFAMNTDPAAARKSQLPSTIKDIIQKFQNTAIVYDFTFDITETNNLDGVLDLSVLLHLSKVTAGVGGGFDRKRESTRTFTITDTFVHLLNDVKDDYCKNYVSDRHYSYPITGTVGIGKMVNTFAQLSLFDNLANDTKGAPPTMTDSLLFTTTLTGSIAPKIVFKPLSNIADASVTALAGRTDAHKVIVALALPVPTPPKQPPAKPSGADTGPGLFVTARGTEAELIAAHAIEQTILRFELGKPGAAALTGP